MFARQDDNQLDTTRSSNTESVHPNLDRAYFEVGSEKSSKQTTAIPTPAVKEEQIEKPSSDRFVSPKRILELIAGKYVAPGILLDCLGLHVVKVPPRKLFSALKADRSAFVNTLKQQSITSLSPSSDAVKILSRAIKVVNNDSSPHDYESAVRILNTATTIDRSTTEQLDWTQECSLKLNGRSFTLSVQIIKPTLLHKLAAFFNPDISKESKKSNLWFKLTISPQEQTLSSKIEKALALTATTLVLGTTPAAITILAMQLGMPYLLSVGLSVAGAATLCFGAIKYKRMKAVTGVE